jgi:hypothetical protein
VPLIELKVEIDQATDLHFSAAGFHPLLLMMQELGLTI